LVDQTGLGLDQCILIAGERFQLGHDGAIRLQAAQLGQLKATHLGKPVGVNLIGLGSCRCAQLIGGLRVDGIDRDARFQQERDEQSMVRFDYARRVLGRSRNAQQKLFQLVQAFVAVGKAPRSHALASEIGHIHVMVGVCPIQTNVPHTRASLSGTTPGDVGSLYSGWQTATSLQSSIGEGVLPGEARSFHIGQAVWRNKSFPGSGYRAGMYPADPWSKGPEKIVTYKENYCMLYFLKVRVDYQRLTSDELWSLWEKEADVALKVKAAGRIVALYKVAGQRRVLVVLDVESHDEIDQALMAAMPLAHYEELEEILPLREYESFASDVKRRWK
jgi:muconolactone delta-isomerase